MLWYCHGNAMAGADPGLNQQHPQNYRVQRRPRNTQHQSGNQTAAYGGVVCGFACLHAGRFAAPKFPTAQNQEVSEKTQQGHDPNQNKGEVYEEITTETGSKMTINCSL